MNIKVQSGKRTITLTKTERNQMAATLAVCDELSKQVNGQLQGAALAAGSGLATLLAEFRNDAAESEPEAGNGQGTQAAAEATTAKAH